MGINIPEVERQRASKALNCDRQRAMQRGTTPELSPLETASVSQLDQRRNALVPSHFRQAAQD